MKKRIYAFLLAAAVAFTAFPATANAEGETTTDTTVTEGTAGEGTTGEGTTDTPEVVTPEPETTKDVPSEGMLASDSVTVKPGEEKVYEINVTYSKFFTYFTIGADAEYEGTYTLTKEGATELSYTKSFSTKLIESAEPNPVGPAQYEGSLKPAKGKYTLKVVFTQTEENKDKEINFTLMVSSGSAYMKKSTVKVTKGYTTTVKVSDYFSKATNLKFKSSKKSVATVGAKNGKVKGKKKGTATITVTGKDSRGYAFKLTCKVKVRDNVYVGTKINKKKASKKNPTIEVVKAYFKNGNLFIDLQVYNPRNKQLNRIQKLEVTVFDASGKKIGVCNQYILVTNLKKKKLGTYTLFVPKNDLKKKSGDIGGGKVKINESDGYLQCVY